MPLSATVTTPVLRETQVNGTGTELFWASRASALTMTVSVRETKAMSNGRNTILPMRVRMACGLLASAALTGGTAVTVILALPSCTPVTSPVCDTRTFVVSEDIHANVRPGAIGTFPASAVAVSCPVPFRKTVESPVITTEVSEEGPVSLAHPAIVSAAPSSRQKRRIRPLERLTGTIRSRHPPGDQGSRHVCRLTAVIPTRAAPATHL